MLPRCTVLMLGNFIAFVLRVWDGPIRFSAFAALHHLQAFNQYSMGVPPLTSQAFGAESHGFCEEL